MDSFTQFQKKHFSSPRGRYDSSKLRHPPMHTVLETAEIEKLIPKGVNNILDFGSGNGRLSIPLLKKGYKVTALDISKGSIKELEKFVKSLRLKIKTTLSIKRIKLVETVVGCDVLHHVNMDTELNALRGKLVKGGTVIFSEPNALCPYWYLYILWKGIWKVEKNIVFNNYFYLKRIFKKWGFQDIEIKGLGLFPRSLFKTEGLCRLNDRLGNLAIFKLFAYRYIIFAHR